MTNTCLKCNRVIGTMSICPVCGKTEEGVGLDQTYTVRIQVFGVKNSPTRLQPLHAQLEAKNLADDLEVLRSIVDSTLSADANEIGKRYKQIDSAENGKCKHVPNDDVILARIIGPLRHAKASFVLGNYIGCIALCGMIAEMLSVMLFEAHENDLIGQPFTNKNTTPIQDVAWFETQKAADRFKCLRDHEIFTQDVYDALELVRDQRNKFLHVYTQDYSKIDEDAKKLYKKLVFGVGEILGQDIRDDEFHLAPKLREWLLRSR